MSFVRAAELFTQAFPLWTGIGGALALIYPPSFLWFKGYITEGLMLIMLGMGLTLTPADLKPVTQKPMLVLGGVFLQFTIMPLLGWSLGTLFGLPVPFKAGLVVVACCPGGTASNVIAFLSRANVALSVAMTAVSTMLAIVLTPILIVMLADKTVAVDGWSLFVNVVQVVLIPVTTGFLLNYFFPKTTGKVAKVSPVVAVIAIVLIVGYILAAQKTAILESGGMLVLAILVLHLGGFIFGGLVAYKVSTDPKAWQAISIEVGMQNSGLGAKLAQTLPAMAMSPTIPAAISALTHCILGSIAAFWFARMNQAEPDA